MKNTGTVERMNSAGGTMPSKRPPRRQALTAPATVPITNAITVVTPTRPSVHGSLEPISLTTETFWAVTPKWPVRQLPRYWK